MTSPRFDVLAIGNAIVDVMAAADEALLAREGLTKGGMMLIDADRATSLYEAMGPAQEISGGSAANTLAGLAAMGCNCAFIGQVADDQLGEVFAHDVRALGIDYATPVRTGDDTPTARCLILVTPDGQRTMNTFLGASQFLPASALDAEMIQDAAVLYLEGYLWDPEEPRAAMRAAIDAARSAGRKVAFTLSDAFVIDRHRGDFLDLLDKGQIDILFSNEAEICSLAQVDDFEAAVAMIAAKLPTLVVTRSEHGAIAVQDGQRFAVPAEPIDKVVDTTGAGDLFAAGFLAGQAQGHDAETSLKMGAIAAAEIISHFGARSSVDLKALIAQKLG
ncbi:adenosine kinase [Blastomonas sp. AAP53]|uniref:adenosine kinase n=1 Tax=Blastomonas sp. AAP53 TaxID=1248760 RepID=UPI0004775F8B|nr:adenosine kinase [Blastomonas sp. AAP53]